MECVGQIAIDDEAVARQRHRRCDQLRQREFARSVFAMRQRKPGHRARHADGQTIGDRFLRIGVALLVEEARAVDRRSAPSRDNRSRHPACFVADGSP